MNYSHRFTFINCTCTNNSKLIKSTFSRAYIYHAWCTINYIKRKLYSNICNKQNSRVKQSNLSSDATRII